MIMQFRCQTYRPSIYIFLSDGGAHKRRWALENYPLNTPTGLRSNVSYALPVSR